MAVITWVDMGLGMGWTGGNNCGHNGGECEVPRVDMGEDWGMVGMHMRIGMGEQLGYLSAL